MKLRQKDKDILREKVEEELESVKEGERVRIDKEALEELLFDEVITLYNGEEIIVKLPVWSGAFLRKIDLSEVSFDNVLWNPFMGLYLKGPGAIKKINEFIKCCIDNDVDYSYTNAKIDFKKSINNLSESVMVFEYCNFSGLDLTNSFPSAKKIFMENCVLQNAKLLQNVDNSEFLNRYSFLNCDLTGVDLSHFTVDVREIIGVDGMINDCVLTNTGLNITMSDRQFGYDYEEMCKTSSWNKERFNQQIAYAKRYLADEIQTDRLAGCYLNGKLIHSREERIAEGQRRLQEHNEMKESLIENVLSGIKTKKLGTK